MSVPSGIEAIENIRGNQMISDIRCESCPICLDEMTSKLTVTTVCLHTFCYDCLNKHIYNCAAREMEEFCPYCRSVLFARGDDDVIEDVMEDVIERGLPLSLSDLVGVDDVSLTDLVGVGVDDEDEIELDALVAARPSIYEIRFSNSISNEMFAYDENMINNNNRNILTNQYLREDTDTGSIEILENLDNEANENINSVMPVNERILFTEELTEALINIKRNIYIYMNNVIVMNNNTTYVLQEMLKTINTLEKSVQYCQSLRGYTRGYTLG